MSSHQDILMPQHIEEIIEPFLLKKKSYFIQKGKNNNNEALKYLDDYSLN